MSEAIQYHTTETIISSLEAHFLCSFEAHFLYVEDNSLIYSFNGSKQSPIAMEAIFLPMEAKILWVACKY